MAGNERRQRTQAVRRGIERTLAPKYAQLENILRERVRQFEPGSLLPSESELTREYGVSRLTLQRALAPLVQEGVIARMQGKGTFFLGSDRKKTLQPLSGALESLMVYEDNARAEVLEKVRWTQAAPDVRERLGLGPEDGIVVIKRIAYARTGPLFYIINFLPERFGKLVFEEARDLERHPIVALLRDRHRVKLESATQTIRAVLADSVVAESLELPLGAPVLLVERTYFTTGNAPVQFTRSWYRSDNYKYTVTLRSLGGPAHKKPRKRRR